MSSPGKVSIVNTRKFVGFAQILLLVRQNVGKLFWFSIFARFAQALVLGRTRMHNIDIIAFLPPTLLPCSQRLRKAET